MGNGIVIVSPHFHRKEFACHCGCGFEAVDVELLIILEQIRKEFDRKLVINSGCRCWSWDKHVKGYPEDWKPTSYHVKGMAADFRIEHTPPRIVQDYIDETWPESYGMGYYKDFTHLDVRRRKGRWYG